MSNLEAVAQCIQARLVTMRLCFDKMLHQSRINGGPGLEKKDVDEVQLEIKNCDTYCTEVRKLGGLYDTATAKHAL